jgi:hypothetical protein
MKHVVYSMFNTWKGRHVFETRCIYYGDFQAIARNRFSFHSIRYWHSPCAHFEMFVAKYAISRGTFTTSQRTNKNKGQFFSSFTKNIKA